jgi:hypothetical protein
MNDTLQTRLQDAVMLAQQSREALQKAHELSDPVSGMLLFQIIERATGLEHNIEALLVATGAVRGYAGETEEPLIGCYNCKHLEIPPEDEPCRSCAPYGAWRDQIESKWEPK